ncbi:UDP-N-acetylmuramate dehydrogenase [Vibrio gallaecicus]|uniref:UDP-N-acetylenolpyruvoylglucosamine reductase n=1 Tax=Vibrio gallaecicus TaxID=552386 RepID=A0ABV4NI27_9VIBR
MQSYLNANLKPFHTFSIDQTCEVLVEVHSVEELITVYQSEEWKHLPKLILGKGSNMLFTRHFSGVVIINRILGKKVSDEPNGFKLHISGGEDWPDLVGWSVEKNMAGLENLAMIPGCAGSAPIQNIGAYGVEFKDVCEYVDILCLDTFKVKRLSRNDCLFDYRDSIFKHDLYEKSVVIAIGLFLEKPWKACNHYGPLKELGSDKLSSQSIFNEVCKIRTEKLPDPMQQGNAGSFFKNPVISKDLFDRVQAKFPDIVGYPCGETVKVAAGWLIDQCGYKGLREGGAQIHAKQALVIINADSATSDDVIILAKRVREAVRARFEIDLEHEVRFIGNKCETNLAEIVDNQ